MTPEVTGQYQKNYNTLQAKGTNDVKLNFDSSRIGEYTEAEGFLCVGSLIPLKNPADCTRCPYDKSTYEKTFMGRLCDTCQLCQIGEEAVGLTVLE